MGFSKKGIDVLDIPDLQRRGLVKKVEKEKPQIVGSFNKGYFEISPEQNLKTENKTISPIENQTNAFDFLNSLASSGETPHTQNIQTSNLDLTDIKVKLENLEYKLERFMERLAILETKISEKDLQ